MKRMLAAAVLATVACTEPRSEPELLTPETIAMYPCVAESRSYPQGESPVYTIDERFADVSRRVPGGFAVTIHPNIVYLKDLTKADDARPILAEEFGGDPLGFVFREARYDWLELISCYRALRLGGIWNTPIIASDIDEVRNRLVLVVQDLADEERIVRRRIRELRVPQEMVVVLEGTMPTLD